VCKLERPIFHTHIFVSSLVSLVFFATRECCLALPQCLLVGVDHGISKGLGLRAYPVDFFAFNWVKKLQMPPFITLL